MKFTETRFEGAWLVELQPACDERGFFAASWDRGEFAGRGLAVDLDECAISFNHRRGTLRGLHYQATPLEQAKLVRCTSGAIWDVIVDLRPTSATRGLWQAFELSAANRRSLYIPQGLAHGFQTLIDDSEVFYQMSGRYAPEAARGIRWDDPALAVEWPPVPERIVAPRDREWPLLQGAPAGG
jgi:dTDP-4-dehydrorhamnose 3,5-epimerase